MMVVTVPVLPPSFEPDGFHGPPGPSSAASRGSTPSPASFPVFQSNTYVPPHPTLPPPPPTEQQLRAPPKLDPEVVLHKASLPPTPEPSPPQKQLFPVQMVALAPPADDSQPPAPSDDNEHLADGQRSPASSDSSPSTNASIRRPSAEAEHLPRVVDLRRSLSSTSPTKATSMQRSETQPPAMGRLMATGRTQSYDDRQRKSRRSTFAAPGPSTGRMVETRNADPRSRLRSTTNANPRANLKRYPTLPSDYPMGLSRLRSPEMEASTSTSTSTSARPAHGFPRTATDFDTNFDFGADGLEAKVVLLGSQGVGKTSLILRLTTGSFSSVPAPASLDGSLYKRKLVHQGVPIKLQIWDTAGQERFRSMAPIYYRGAHVCILVYDISDRDSFMDVRSWLEELSGKASKDMIIYVVGAKTDLESKREVTFGEARRVIRTWLKPHPPSPEPETEGNTLSLPPRGGLFRSTSTRSRTDSVTGPSPQRARPHSMHGLASLMATATTDFGELDPASSGISTPAAGALSPYTGPTVHFPASITSSSHTGSAGASAVTSPNSSTTLVSTRRHRVSFHAPAPPSQPTFGTTAETAVASTANSAMRARHTPKGFSISGLGGVLGLTRSQSMNPSEALSNLELLAEANDLHRQQPGPLQRCDIVTSPSLTRARTESSPRLGTNLPKQRSEEWSRGWTRGEGPPAADALEEFGAVMRSQELERKGRPRGGSLGCDSRLAGSDPRQEKKPSQWGIEIEGVRLGEVSSLTGDGVEALCRSISTALVARKDKIERERTIRRKHSVMLTDSSAADTAGKSKGRYGCCA